MRHPLYMNHMLHDGTKSELIFRETYWNDLLKVAYDTAVERVMDRVLSYNFDPKKVCEIQVGNGLFLDSLKATLTKIYNIEDVGFFGVEHSDMLSERLGDYDILSPDDEVSLSEMDMFFIVESLPSIPDWKEYLTFLWNSAKVGSYFVVVDTQVPTQYRDYLARFENCACIDKFVVDEYVCFRNQSGRNRKVKTRLFQKVE